MPITNDQVTGFFVGLGVASLGFYLYKRNETLINDYLHSVGLNGGGRRHAGKSLEELVEEKEHLEDLIAEMELRSQKDGEKPEQKPEQKQEQATT